jgi:hypothetical protein
VRPRKKRARRHFLESRGWGKQSENAGSGHACLLLGGGGDRVRIVTELFKATLFMESLILAQDERWRRA